MINHKIVSFFTVLLLVKLWAAPVLAKAAPDASVPAGPAVARFDFGTVSTLSTAPIAHTFGLTNTGTAPMVVEMLKPSCTCTTVALGDYNSRPLPAVLAPGERTSIHVAVDPTVLAPGPVDKYVWVFIRGNAGPKFQLEMVGTLAPPPDPVRGVRPATLTFGSVPLGQDRVQVLTVTWDTTLVPAGKTPRPVCADPDVHIQPLGPAQAVAPALAPPPGLEPPTPAGPRTQSQDYQITLSPRTQLGLLTEKITFAVTAPAAPGAAPAADAPAPPDGGPAGRRS